MQICTGRRISAFANRFLCFVSIDCIKKNKKYRLTCTTPTAASCNLQGQFWFMVATNLQDEQSNELEQKFVWNFQDCQLFHLTCERRWLSYGENMCSLAQLYVAAVFCDSQKLYFRKNNWGNEAQKGQSDLRTSGRMFVWQVEARVQSQELEAVGSVRSGTITYSRGQTKSTNLGDVTHWFFVTSTTCGNER